MASYDKKINNLFFYWLLVSFCLVFLIVIVGGLTRLTNSGLSITQWELFSGILPPLTSEKWKDYFNYYKQIPQFQIVNNKMSLAEFKIIFYWEYFHRVLGRVIGLFFMIPLIYFIFTKKIKKRYINICLLIFLLIIFQGIVGWYMVKSGLVNNITVSHFRLSTHLSIAFIIISLIFWCILEIKYNLPKNFIGNKKYTFIFIILILSVFIQVIFGAFVSGLDAGKIYQTWPLMNYNYFPDDTIIASFVDLLNFKNHGLVQFYHRNLAYIISLYILLVGFFIYIKNFKYIFKPYLFVFLILILQVCLGIFTLISGLNIYLASAHQIFSLILILGVINLHYRYLN